MRFLLIRATLAATFLVAGPIQGQQQLLAPDGIPGDAFGDSVALSSLGDIAIVGDWVRRRTCDEVLRALGPEGADLPCARVSRPDELIDDPQLIARDMIERHPHPTLGEVVFHGNPLRFGDAEPRRRPLAPDLGEHNAEVYAELGLGDAELRRLSEAGVI